MRYCSLSTITCHSGKISAEVFYPDVFCCGLLHGKDVGQKLPPGGSRGTGDMGCPISNAGSLQVPLPPAFHSKAAQTQHAEQKQKQKSTALPSWFHVVKVTAEFN